MENDTKKALTRSGNNQKKAPEATAGSSIKKPSFIIIVILALFFDIPEIILTLLDLSVWLIPVFELTKLLAAFVAPFVLFLALRLSGVKMTWKDALIFLGAGIIKGVPVINGIPTWTAAVIKIAGPLVAKNVLKDVGGKIPGGMGKKLEQAIDASQNISKGNIKGALQDVKQIAQKEEEPQRNSDNSSNLARNSGQDTEKPLAQMDSAGPKTRNL